MVTSRGDFVTSFTFNGGVGENPYPIFELTLNESFTPNRFLNNAFASHPTEYTLDRHAKLERQLA